MNIIFDLPQKEYYHKALASIPKEHTHRDEIVSLLIDQVIDDSNGYAETDLSSNEARAGTDLSRT